MAKAYKIMGYLLDSNDYYDGLDNKVLEYWFDGGRYVGMGEFHSAVFKVESTDVKDEDIYDEDGSSSGWREEDFKKYFKA
jgi:hypothetical protein